jgi:presequence protease
MNAFTAADHTFYPFATTNYQDYRNLVSVYMDATFHPLLRPHDFLQEGWRVGPVNPQALLAEGHQATDEDRRLAFKGVVYNEMKGQMSDADYYFYIKYQEAVMPDLMNSGGDPAVMTRLSHSALKTFHRTTYAPRNAKFFTYGDIPITHHLEQIDNVIKHVSELPDDSLEHKDNRPAIKGGQSLRHTGPLDPLVDPLKQSKSSLSWCVSSTHEKVENFAWGILSSLLMEGYSSPFYRGLIESGLGTDFTPNSGYDGSYSMGIFTIGLSGMQESDVPRLKDTVRKILSDAFQQPFDQAKIDGYLHQLELALKHKTAGFGMALLQRVMPRWFTAGQNPVEALAWNEVIDGFKKKMKAEDGMYLNQLLGQYLLADGGKQLHGHLSFTVAPSAEFGADLQKDEDHRLQTKITQAVEKYGSEEKAQKHFVQQELELLEFQKSAAQESVDCLPTVSVLDIPLQKAQVNLRNEDTVGAKIQWREATTNGLTYFRAINTIENLPSELRALMPLFADAVMRLGTEKMTTERLEDEIKLKTGGISVGYHGTSLPADRAAATEGISMSAMALDRNVPAMFDLLHQVIAHTNFNSDNAVRHIRQLLQSAADGVINDVASEGHSFARRSAEASLGLNAWRAEEVSGLAQIKVITSLAGRSEADQLEDVIAKLKEIQRLACVPGNFRAAVTCGSENVTSVQKAVHRFFSDLGSGQKGTTFPQSGGYTLSRDIKTFFPLPYQVYYGALALPGTSYTNADGAPLQILSQLLTHKHLHHEIREKGGAYGGGAYYRALDGIFGLYSYRDPNPLNTLSIMQTAGQWAVDKQWTDRDLEEAKISVFQAIDAPQDINDEGMNSFLYGIDQAMEQRRRESLLSVSKQAVQDVAQRYLVDGLRDQRERVAFIGEKQRWVDESWKIEEMTSVANALEADSAPPEQPVLQADTA